MLTVGIMEMSEEEKAVISEAMRLLGKRTSDAKKASSRANGRVPKKKKKKSLTNANG